MKGWLRHFHLGQVARRGRFSRELVQRGPLGNVHCVRRVPIWSRPLASGTVRFPMESVPLDGKFFCWWLTFLPMASVTLLTWKSGKAVNETILRAV